MSQEPMPGARPRGEPWIFRTYGGHSSPDDSNRLFRTNLARGQTGLSVAFDLPTQTGYDSDHPLARGEVGKVGVPVCHLGDMARLFAEIPLDRSNCSMTINAPAAWMLALYVALAERQGVPRRALAGTTQNDIIKEYLSRGTYIFPPGPSLRLTGDVIAFASREMPKWNPVNICSYHLQEAGATAEQELAFAMATAIAILDQVRQSGQIAAADFPQVVGRMSFFVNAGIRFVGEVCKMRAFTRVWDRLCRDHWGVADPALRRFRYGVQVNSLGLTEQQPENNVYRILLETLGVVLSRNARARAVQLPAWNEALGLPRPWDQQWSLRMQQVLAYETDLLEFGDIFDGSPEIERRVGEIIAAAEAELVRIAALGGAVSAVEQGYMKRALVQSNRRRLAAIERGEQVVVGVNRFVEGEVGPAGLQAGAVQGVDPAAEQRQIAALAAWRASRDEDLCRRALSDLRQAVVAGHNLMEPSIACAHAGVTGGEWAACLRELFGEYRAPTGVGPAVAGPPDDAALGAVRLKVDRIGRRLGRRVKMLVGKPGLDGHSNGAEQIAVRARDVGIEVVYEGIRLTPSRIVNTALEEGVHLVGLSILSGSHLSLVSEVLARMRDAGLADIPVVAGGIIPPDDARLLLEAGCARVYTPKDFDLTAIMGELIDLLDDPAAGRLAASA